VLNAFLSIIFFQIDLVDDQCVLSWGWNIPWYISLYKRYLN